jgi:peptidoglycan/xylan/chitin deacetylase (PgdA/CDA1 family)
VSDDIPDYAADRSLKGKLRRRFARLMARRPAPCGPERPTVSFSFDDAPATAVEQGAAILEAAGLRGTYFVAAGLAGRTGVMGRDASGEELMTAHRAGHELACHTFSHLDCGQAARAQIVSDAARNSDAFRAWGAPPPTTFAYPYGDVSVAAKRALGGRFGVLRALHHGLIGPGSDLNQAPAVGIEGADGEAIASAWIDRAAQANAWLILYTHDVTDQPSPFGCTPDALKRLVDEALEAGCEVVTVAEGAKRVAA